MQTVFTTLNVTAMNYIRLEGEVCAPLWKDEGLRWALEVQATAREAVIKKKQLRLSLNLEEKDKGNQELFYTRQCKHFETESPLFELLLSLWIMVTHSICVYYIPTTLIPCSSSPKKNI